jgi:hypothetical protein
LQLLLDEKYVFLQHFLEKTQKTWTVNLVYSKVFQLFL